MFLLLIIISKTLKRFFRYATFQILLIKPNSFVWFDVPAEQVINFFEGMQSVENLKKAEPRKLDSIYYRTIEEMMN